MLGAAPSRIVTETTVQVSAQAIKQIGRVIAIATDLGTDVVAFFKEVFFIIVFGLMIVKYMNDARKHFKMPTSDQKDDLLATLKDSAGRIKLMNAAETAWDKGTELSDRPLPALGTPGTPRTPGRSKRKKKKKKQSKKKPKKKKQSKQSKQSKKKPKKKKKKPKKKASRGKGKTRRR